MMSNELETKLLEITTDLDKDISFSYDSNLYYKALEIVNNATETEFTDYSRRLMLEIFLKLVVKTRDFCNELWKGMIKTTGEDLNLLETNFKEILGSIDGIKKSFPEDILHDEYVNNVKQGIQKVQKDLIPVVRQFANVYDQINKLGKDNFSWSLVQKLYRQAQTIQAPNSATTETVKMTKMSILLEIVENIHGFEKAVESGELPVKLLPDKQDLDFFWEICSEASKTIDWMEREKASEIKNYGEIANFRKNNESLKTWIQQERKKGELSEGQKQKIESQQEEINQLKKQLDQLQKQIEELQELKKQDSERERDQTNQRAIPRLIHSKSIKN